MLDLALPVESGAAAPVHRLTGIKPSGGSDQHGGLVVTERQGGVGWLLSLVLGLTAAG